MPKQNQSVRINQLAAVMEQVCLHFKTMVGLMVADSEPIQEHVQQLADICGQVADSQVAQFDFSITPGEEVPA